LEIFYFEPRLHIFFEVNKKSISPQPYPSKDYLISLKKFYFDFVLTRKILLPETIDTFKGVKSLSEICKEFRKSRNLKEEKLEFMDIRPCLLVALYSWKEMCILELFDDSSELIQFDELPFKDAIKLRHWLVFIFCDHQF
jgi:hypothetical protein